MSNYSHREDVGAGESILGAVRRNPEGLLLLAAGAALLMRRSGTPLSTDRTPRQKRISHRSAGRRQCSQRKWSKPRRPGGAGDPSGGRVCLRRDGKGKPNGKCLRVFGVRLCRRGRRPFKAICSTGPVIFAINSAANSSRAALGGRACWFCRWGGRGGCLSRDRS